MQLWLITDLDIKWFFIGLIIALISIEFSSVALLNRLETSLILGYSCGKKNDQKLKSKQKARKSLSS